MHAWIDLLLSLLRWHVFFSLSQIEVNPDEQPAKKPTVMGIGVEGGFDVDKPRFELQTEYNVVVFPERRAYPLDSPDLPDMVRRGFLSI